MYPPPFYSRSWLLTLQHIETNYLSPHNWVRHVALFLYLKLVPDSSYVIVEIRVVHLSFPSILDIENFNGAGFEDEVELVYVTYELHFVWLS